MVPSGVAAAQDDPVIVRRLWKACLALSEQTLPSLVPKRASALLPSPSPHRDRVCRPCWASWEATAEPAPGPKAPRRLARGRYPRSPGGWVSRTPFPRALAGPRDLRGAATSRAYIARQAPRPAGSDVRLYPGSARRRCVTVRGACGERRAAGPGPGPGARETAVAPAPAPAEAVLSPQVRLWRIPRRMGPCTARPAAEPW